jgi:hypothetical protein
MIPRPVEMAFEDLCKRFDLFLSRMKSLGDTQRWMIILDKTTRETSRRSSAASSARLAQNGDL